MYKKLLALALILGSLIAQTAFAAAFPFALGGTGTTSPNIGQLTYWGSSNLKGIATTTVTCAGTVACSGFVIIGSAPITITGSGSASADFTFLSNYSAISAATSSPLWAQGGLFASSTSHLSNFDALAATTSSFAITSLASALLMTDASGNALKYAGTTCTNQFVRVLSALGAATCATVGAADVALANLTATNASLTFSGTYDGSTARTIGLNVANSNSWSVHQIFTSLNATNATTTNATTTGTLAIPVSTLRFYDGTSEKTLNTIVTRGAALASSTLAYIGGYGATGSTTIRMLNNIHSSSLYSFFCKTDVGTAFMLIGNGSATSTLVQCSTTGTSTGALAVPVAFTMRQDMFFQIGTQASSPNVITISVDLADTAD